MNRECKCGHFDHDHYREINKKSTKHFDYHSKPPGHLPIDMDRIVNHNSTPNRCSKCDCRTFESIHGKWKFWK